MKKILSLVLSFLVLISLVSCSSSTPTNSLLTTKVVTTEKFTIRYSWWGGEARHKATLDAMDAYMVLHPNIKMEGEYSGYEGYHEKLLTQLAGGTAPDIAQVDYKMSAAVISQGHPFVNMNDLTKIIDTSHINMDFANAYGSDGDYLVGLPAGVSGVGLYYNLELAKKLNLTLTDDLTWDGLLELGKKVKQADSSKYLMFALRDVFGYIMKSQIRNWNGNPIIKDDKTLGFTRDEMLKCMTYVKNLVDTGTVPPFEVMVPYEESHPDSQPNWLAGEYVMYPHFASIATAIISASPFKIDCVRWPIDKNPVDPGVLGTPSAFIGVTKSSAHPEEAAKFINFMLNEKDGIMILKDARGIPVNTEAAKMLEDAGVLAPVAVKMTKQVLENMGAADNAISLDPEVMDLVYEYIYEVGYGRQTPAKATDGLMAALTNLLKSK